MHNNLLRFLTSSFDSREIISKPGKKKRNLSNSFQKSIILGGGGGGTSRKKFLRRKKGRNRPNRFFSVVDPFAYPTSDASPFTRTTTTLLAASKLLPAIDHRNLTLICAKICLTVSLHTKNDPSSPVCHRSIPTSSRDTSPRSRSGSRLLPRPNFHGVRSKHPTTEAT